jgi:hypothetical protein
MRRIVVFAALIVLSATLLPTVARGAPQPGGAITFGVPRIVDPIHVYSEPDIKVGPTGTIHASGPQGTGVQRSIWNVSVDDGDSWRLVQALPAKQAAAPNKTAAGPGGGDTEIAVSRNNRTFFSDLWALTCFTAATTPNDGVTVQSNAAGCSSPPGDRQWMGLFDPAPEDQTVSPYTGPRPLVYQAYDDLQGDRIDKSVDGLTYTQAGHYADTDTEYVANGNIAVDQHTGKVLGVVGEGAAGEGLEELLGGEEIPASAPSGSVRAAATEDTTPPQKYGLAVAIGTPDAAGDLTFEYHTITTTIPGDPQTLFPVLAQDKARNAYVVWAVGCDDPAADDACYHVFYSWASAATDWSQWSPPKQLDSSPSSTSLMPWVAAGGDGIIDVVWYGTDQRLNPSDKQNQAWDVYMAQVSSADSSHPKVAQGKVTPHPMHYDDICMLGTGCITEVGNRNLADFFQVTIDNDGRARVIYPDTSNRLMQYSEPLDHPGAPLVTVATQSTGLDAWTGRPLRAGESAAPVSGISDPGRDALFPVLGGVPVDGMDVRDVALALHGDTLDITVTTAGGSLGDGAATAGGTAGQLVVRWQTGDTLYYAAVEEPAGSDSATFYAGPTQSVDLCSVSACKPNYLVYPAPPAGGTAIDGTVTATDTATTYVLHVPVSAIGDLTPGDLLEEVMAFTAAAPTSAALPMTSAQAFADEVPLQLEGTRTFNYRAG